MTKIDIVSFDLFDTLVYVDEKKYIPEQLMQFAWNKFNDNSFEIAYSIFNKTLQEKLENRLKPPFKEENYNSMLHQSMKDLGFEKSEKLSRVITEVDENYTSTFIDSCYLHTHTINTLKKLKDENYKIVLTSDLSRASTGHLILEKYNLKKYFNKITFSGEVGYRKPSTEIFSYSLDGLPLTSRQKVIHIGDNFYTDILGILEFGGEAIWLQDTEKIDELMDDRYSNYKSRIKAIIQHIGQLDGIFFS
jgi:FMN phosphatase YigB (HAD superfamily)